MWRTRWRRFWPHCNHLCSPHGPLTQRGRPARVAPDFFSRKRNRGKKRRRGELLVPLSTPLQKGGLLRGPPHFLAVTCSFCGYLFCMAVQRFPHRRKAWFKWHQAGAILPQQNFSRDAHWGECRGGSAPSVLSFPPLSLAKKAVLPPSRRPVRRGQKPPAWPELVPMLWKKKKGNCTCSCLFWWRLLDSNQ